LIATLLGRLPRVNDRLFRFRLDVTQPRLNTREEMPLLAVRAAQGAGMRGDAVHRRLASFPSREAQRVQPTSLQSKITSPRNAPRNLWLYEKFQRDIGEREEDGPRKCQPERFRPPQPFEQGETHQKRVLSMWERLVGLKVTPAQPERRIKTAKAGSQRIDAPQVSIGLYQGEATPNRVTRPHEVER
jgi:hypothetical protein